MATVTSIVLGYASLVVSATGEETDLVAATGYNIGLPVPGTTALAPKSLLSNYGGGKHSYATNVELICYATCNEDDDCAMSIYGISDGGPPERIGVLTWVFGKALVSSGIRWADECGISDTYQGTIARADQAGDRICKITLGTTGYRYLYAIVDTTATGDATAITVLMRPYS